jgi:hypothetical protein
VLDHLTCRSPAQANAAIREVARIQYLVASDDQWRVDLELDWRTSPAPLVQATTPALAVLNR